MRVAASPVAAFTIANTPRLPDRETGASGRTARPGCSGGPFGHRQDRRQGLGPGRPAHDPPARQVGLVWRDRAPGPGALAQIRGARLGPGAEWRNSIGEGTPTPRPGHEVS